MFILPHLKGLTAGNIGSAVFKNASLDLKFADNKSLVDAVTGASLVTFTRASSGTYVDSAGVLQTAATDVPRFDHNPLTGESLGLLVEEQRTNSIRNNTMVGAVAGTPGTLPTNWSITTAGLTTSVVATGSIGSLSYIDVRLQGTAASAAAGLQFGSAGEVACSTGQTWTLSFYVAVVGGSTANVTGGYIGGNLYASASYAGELTGASFSLGSTLNRQTTTGTINPASVTSMRPYFQINLVNGAAVDITLRIGLPQAEQGAFATSPIPTTTAAATRSADVASITGTAFSGWYNASAGTTYTSAQIGYTVPGGSFPVVAAINDGTASNRLEYGYLTAALAGFGVVTGGVDQGSVFPPTTASIRNLIGAYQLNNGAASVNGGTVSTISTMSVPVVNQLTIGRAPSAGNPVNGHIRRLVYWGQRLPNNVLQAITQ